MPARIRTDDQVVVISGKDRGKRGRVLRVDRKHDRVYVEGLNMIKRHQKANPASSLAQQTSGVIEKEGGIHVSNVALVDPKDGRPTRIGIEVADGKRMRVARRSGTRLD
ncbi:MAG: 50S ribosomal protein L24 [Actinomycetota bacterium]|nr:50S ribosomal protein L24 [Actinomycetota bacterium]